MLREVALKGRKTELTELANALRRAGEGRGIVALLSGDAGIGKTRLADELARSVQNGEARVAWGRSWETGGTPAYFPWIQVLRALVAARGLEAVKRDGDARVADLVPLVPELGSGSAGTPEVTDPVQARFRLFDAVACFLRASSTVKPIVVVLDDLHAADLSSLHLLAFLARQLRSMRVLVIGTYREAEARFSTERMELLTAIGREGAVFPLKPLGSADVAALVRSGLGSEVDDELLLLTERRSEGNPLFLVEMLRLFGTSRDRRALEVPETVRALARARLAAVDPSTCNVVELASVFGRDFSEPLLSRVGNLARASVRERLEDAARAGLVAPLGGERWAFSNILLREALYDFIPAELRARLHASIANRLEAVSDDQPASLGAIVHHRLRGAPESGIRPAVESALALGKRSLRLFALEDAVTALESALALLDAVPNEGELRSNVLTLLGEAQIRLGRTEQGKQACRAAAELARFRGDAEGLARAALAFGSEVNPGEVDLVLVRYLEQALAMLGTGNVGLKARVSARLAAARQPAHDASEPMAMARDAVALARSIGDEETLRYVIHYALAALVDYAEPDEVAPLCEEAVALATAAGDNTQILRNQGRLVFANLERGDTPRADASIAAYEALCRGLPAQYRADALMMRSMRSLMGARFAEAEELIAHAREIHRPSSNEFSRVGALFNDFARDLVMERADRVLARRDEMAEATRALGELGVHYVHAFSACALARLGDHDAARLNLEQIPDNATLMTGEPQGQRLVAEAVAAVGDSRRARLLEARMDRMARRVTTWGRMVMVCDAPASRLLGLLAAAQGNDESAVPLLRDALERSRSMGHVAVVPRLCFELGVVLAKGTDPARIEKAWLLLDEASHAAEELGYEALTRSARELAARISVPPPAPQAAKPEQAGGARLVPIVGGFRLVRQGEYYSVSHGSRVARVKDSLGMRLLERLVANPDCEIHVLQLMGAGGVRGNTTGERARVNAQRRLREAIRRIGDELPELGRHLSWAVKTGAVCVYAPNWRE
jgi:tetratricopeptide (TPR) repeat protein